MTDSFSDALAEFHAAEPAEVLLLLREVAAEAASMRVVLRHAASGGLVDLSDEMAAVDRLDRTIRSASEGVRLLRDGAPLAESYGEGSALTVPAVLTPMDVRLLSSEWTRREVAAGKVVCGATTAAGTPCTTSASVVDGRCARHGGRRVVPPDSYVTAHTVHWRTAPDWLHEPAEVAARYEFRAA